MQTVRDFKAMKEYIEKLNLLDKQNEIVKSVFLQLIKNKETINGLNLLDIYPQLNELSFNGNSLKNENIPTFCEFLEKNKTIQILKLEGFANKRTLTKENIELICNSLEKKESLEILTIKNSNFFNATGQPTMFIELFWSKPNLKIELINIELSNVTQNQIVTASTEDQAGHTNKAIINIKGQQVINKISNVDLYEINTKINNICNATDKNFINDNELYLNELRKKDDFFLNLFFSSKEKHEEKFKMEDFEERLKISTEEIKLTELSNNIVETVDHLGDSSEDDTE